ncbi:MAG: ketoacyl-ACP synthase III [Phycisphaerales bacterium]|nr:ketoacyl-ACP synthase III [Phycisphaerales bacterium]
MKRDITASKASLGVRIAGTGSAVPSGTLTNKDLEKICDTSDEWIVKRTGIRERRVCDPRTEGSFTLSRDALLKAIDDAQIDPTEIDLVINATVSMEMVCPSNACRIAAAIGATPAGAFDLTAACSGFVYAMNMADTLVRSGRFRTVAVAGCDAMSNLIDYQDRSVSILFGDAAGAAILTADENPERGCIYQRTEADGRDWSNLYIPRRPQEILDDSDVELGQLRMKGREVYKFAVGKFQWAIKDAMEHVGLEHDEVSVYICHQSNLRIIESAIEKLGLPRERVYVNIDTFGNSSAGSVGLCLDQVRKSGQLPEGEPFIMVAFGGGLTWASSVWIP